MIVSDDQEQRKGTSPQAAGSDNCSPSRNSQASLPDYETSQANLQRTRLLNLFGNKALQNFRQSDRKFWRAVWYALIIYVIVSVSIGVPLIVLALRRGPPSHLPSAWEAKRQQTAILLDHLDLLDLPSLDYNTECDNWETQDTQESHNLLSAWLPSYDIPVDGNIVLRSNYSYDSSNSQPSFGYLNIGIHPDSSRTEGLVSLRMSYSSPDIRERTTVCMLRGNEDTTLSLYIPHNIQNSDTLTFNISLLFPQSPSSPLVVPKLVTYLPTFMQQFGNLGSQVSFGTVSLGGQASTVTVDSLTGGTVDVRTLRAPISGTFNVSESITLDTMYAPVNASINLVRNAQSMGPTMVEISTGNDAINADLTLVPAFPTGEPQFFAILRTFDGPLDARVVHAPSAPPTVYHLRAINNVAPTNVVVDSKFEGTFDVSTKYNTVAVLEGTDSDNLLDPRGNGQSRQYDYDLTTPTQIIGWVGWGPRRPPPPRFTRHGKHSEGRLKVESSLSPVTLRLSESVTEDGS